MIDLRLKTLNEDIISNLSCLTKNLEQNKSDIDDLFEKFENQICENVRSESRLSESERWMGEMKTNLTFLISESDLIRGNLKKYQVLITLALLLNDMRKSYYAQPPDKPNLRPLEISITS